MITLADLSKKKVAELRKIAARYGVPGRTDMTKGQILAALEMPLMEERLRHLEKRVSALEATGHRPNPFEVMG